MGLAMIDKKSETIEKLSIPAAVASTPDQMVAFVAGAREIIAKYTPKIDPVRQHPRREEPITGRAPLAGAFPIYGTAKMVIIWA